MKLIRALTFAACFGWNALCLHLCLVPALLMPLWPCLQTLSKSLKGPSCSWPWPHSRHPSVFQDPVFWDPTQQTQAHPPPLPGRPLCIPCPAVSSHGNPRGCSLDQKLLEARDGVSPSPYNLYLKHSLAHSTHLNTVSSRCGIKQTRGCVQALL